MIDSTFLQKQRELIRSLNQVLEERNHLEEQARQQRDKEQQQADKQFSELRELQRAAQQKLTPSQTDHVNEQVRLLPPPEADTNAEPAHELQQCVAVGHTVLSLLSIIVKIRGSRDRRRPLETLPDILIVITIIWLIVSFFIAAFISTNIVQEISGVANPVASVCFLSSWALVFAVPSLMVEKWRQKKIVGYISELAQAAHDAEHWHQQWTNQIQTTYQRQIDDITERFRPEIENHYTALAEQTEKANNHIPPWCDDTFWSRWSTDAMSSMPTAITRLGTLTFGHEHEKFIVPALLPFPGNHSLLLSVTNSTRSLAFEGIQALILRLLAVIPPGRVRFTFIDPVGLGQNVKAFMRLVDQNEALIHSCAWTERHHIEQRLANLTEHMQNVIQKYLQNKYETIEDYNLQAVEIAEPYQVLVALDFPVNFQEDACRRLVSIAENGPRCGVFAIIVANEEKPLPHGFRLAELEQVTTVIKWDTEHNRWFLVDDDYQYGALTLEVPPATELANRILDTVGQASVEAGKVEVPFDPIAPLPEQWWKADSSDGLSAALGPSGADKHQLFEVGKGTTHHALVVGKIGSGKSTLLHTLITSIVLNYSPEEVELYLIDFKKGVEFKPYAIHQLPQARVIAIESEREFGLSVLEGLYREYERRGNSFRNINVANLQAYRKETGQTLPRILLLVDEFHKFFIEDDKLATRAYQLLELLVREGRNAGIHIVLASQTLTGAAHLPDAIKEQIGIRIALQCSEADSRLILSDNNAAARLLSRPGEAIYNAANGLVEGNNSCQVAWMTDAQREQYLTALQRRAQADAYHTSQIVFEGNQPADIEKNHSLEAALVAPAPAVYPRDLKAWLGEPVAIEDSVAALFQRQSSSNLLIVGQDNDLALGMLVIALISLAAQLPVDQTSKACTFSILDFSVSDSEQARLITQLAEHIPHSVAVGRQRQLQGMMTGLEKEVQRRIEGELYSEPPLFLCIYGLQRARDLRQDDDMDSTSFSFDDEPPPPNSAKQFATVLRDGPEVGIHTILWCDSLRNLERTFERRQMREFALRVVFQMAAEDSSNLIDSTDANQLGPYRALFYDEDGGIMKKFRPYHLPTKDWLERVTVRLHAQHNRIASK